MAKYKYTSGMSTNDILNIDIDEFNKLNRQQMREYVERIAATANKRLRTLKKRGMNTPAVQQVNQSRRGTFSTRGKNLNELRAEFMRAKRFLQGKTSTVAGWKNVVNSTIKTLKTHNINISSQQFNEFWQTYQKLVEKDPTTADKNMKYEILRELNDQFVDKSNDDLDEIIAIMQSKLDDLYKESVSDYDTGASQFFNQVE